MGKRIVLFTGGTLGDHLPFIALGQALGQRGHRVSMVLNSAMVGYATQAGLEVAALPDIERGPDHARQNAHVWDHWAQLEGRPTAPDVPDISRDMVVAQARMLADHSRNADLLITTSIRVQGYVAARATGVPWLTVSMNPSAFFRPTVSGSPAMAQVVATHRTAAALCAELGAAAPPPLTHPGDLFAPRVLLASSQHFSTPAAADLPPATTLTQTGFWFYEDPAWATWQPDPALARFVSGPRPPIALSFSSQPVTDPAAVLASHARAAQRLGLPLLVQRGWAGFAPEHLPADIDPASVYFADFLPHDWLFAHAACSIQHGGIGSIGRTLRQGCPLLIEPYGNDQFFNAMRAMELGVAASMHPHKLSVDGLVDVLRAKVLQPAYRQRAREIGARIAAEDGLAQACDEIESRFFAPTTPPGQTIPKIIHQTWKTNEIPAQWQAYQQSWQQHHPDWQYRLWTDDELRDLVAREYSWLLPIYDNYSDPIMRVDAARYVLLHRYGGIYADMDYECLRSFAPLLAGRTLVFGEEPAAHLDMPLTRASGLPHLVCNALMASEAGHPFWDHVFKQLVACHKAVEPLGATGPHMLTAAYDTFPGKARLSLLGADVLHPLTSVDHWATMPAEQRARIAGRAYGLHHWHNTWCNEPITRKQRQLPCMLLEQGRTLMSGQFDLNEYSAQDNLPLVSCMMVTRGRAALAMRAIHCFQIQSYPARELVIIDDDHDDTLARAVAALHDPRIIYTRLPASALPLGELRNLALARTTGAYVAQWDDDDLSAPDRLAVQMAAITTLRADACFLQRHTLWWPQQRRFAHSNRRIWEGSFVASKAVMSAYPALPRGEDTPVIARILSERRAAVLDAPQLYTYVFHGANTFDAQHWNAHWRNATATFEGTVYHSMLGALARLHRIEPDGTPPGRQNGNGAALQQTQPTPHDAEAILIAVPVKNAAAHLPRFLANLRHLNYPHSQISIAFLESDSSDGTFTLLEQLLPELERDFARAVLIKHDFDYQHDGPRWTTSVQAQRRAVLAQSRNLLLHHALANEAWVLWIDVDVADWPRDIIGRLLAAKQKIVVPNCLVAPAGRTFDYNTFALTPDAATIDWAAYTINGLIQPPIGLGRRYLNDMRSQSIVELDAVGSTMLLVKADLHRGGLLFPETSYKGYIETEGLVVLARDMGVRSYGLPNVEIIHPSH